MKKPGRFALFHWRNRENAARVIASKVWRGLHPPNNKNIFKSFIGENYQVPSFDLSLGLFWKTGINGEKFISGVPTGS